MVVIECVAQLRDRDEAIYVHTASSLEKAEEWIKKHGEGWYEEPYKFQVFDIIVDKEKCFEPTTPIVCFTKDGERIVENEFS